MTKKLKFIVLLLICSLLNVNLAWGDTDTYDFNTAGITRVSGPSNGDQTSSSTDVVFKSKTGNTTDSWTIEFTGETYYGYGANNGVHFGKKAAPPHATLTSKSYSNVTGVSITSTQGNASVTITVSVGGTSFGSLTSGSNTTHSFSHAAATGAVSINVESNTNGRFQINSVTITYSDAPTCTELGQINGSINLTQGGTSVTIKDWSAVSNAGSYTVKMYHYNTGTSEWDLVSGTSSLASGSEGTKTGVTDISTGVTFTGLTLNDDYRFSVQAIASSATYCDGDETFVTSINSTDVSSTPFRFRYSICIDDGSGSNWTHHYITPTANANEGSVSINLPAHVDSYQFKIYGGFSGDWGQTGTAKIPSATKWTLDGSNQVKLHTGAGGAYVFTVDYSTTNPGVTVTFPSADQAAGHKIYFDKSIIADWGNTLKYRIGNGTHNQNQDFTLVPGTDQFYVTTTPNYGSMDAWQIANNVAWTGTHADEDHGIYNYYHNDDTYNITRATVFFDYIVEEDITMVPSTQKNTENSCDFWYVNKTSGMLTHTATITAPTNGTIHIAYTDVNSTAQDKTVTTAGLAHRTKITATATPATGYKTTAFTVTPSGEEASNLTSGATDNHILAKDATFAATFAAKQAAITFDKNSGTSGNNGTTATYGTAMTTITAPTRDGYTFGGYYDAETSNNGSGTQYYNANGTSARTWDKDTEEATTLYANWTATPYTITYHLNDGTNPGGVPTGFTIESALITLPTPTREGYNFIGWYANENLSTGGVQTTIAAGSTGDKEYWAKWEIKKYTVTWHVGESTSTTSNVAHFTTFSTLEASAPAHADNALAACGSTKFIGWVKASGEYTEDGKTADWYDTHKFSGSDQITADTHVYAMYAEASGAVSDVLNTSNVNTGSTATNSWTDLTVTGSSGAVYKIHTMGTGDEAIRWNSNGYLYCSSGPTSGAKLQSVTIITTANKSIGIYGSTTAYSAKATATSCGNLSATSSGATYNFTSDYNYIGLNGTESSTYINSITISYGSYSNYRTGCTVSCSRPTPATPASITKTGATISWTDPATSGTLDHYEYKVWEDGDDEPVSGTTNGTNLSKALTGLYSGVTYHWKVRRVCSGEDASIWVAGLDFTTTEATLTFSVPTGATAVDPSTTATNLPEADAPTDCGDCWVFVGWTTAAYAKSSSAPATLFPAGIKARVSGDATLYAVYGKDEGKYRIIDDISSITSGENYVLTKGYIPTTDAVGNANSGSYYRQIPPVAITVKTDIIGEYIDNPATTVIWKLIGDASKGRLFNETASLYIDLHASTGSIDYLVSSTSDYINITLYDAETKTFNIGSNTTSTNYLFYWTDEEDDNVHWWGVDDEHDGFSSCCIFKHVYASYATSPSCPKYTVTWDINNGATTSTTDVTKCEGYLSALPSAPADNTLSGCQTNGKFMGWSANKVMPAQDIAPADIFSAKKDAPKITENVTFYAVFANGVAGAETPVNTTYTFNSKSWGDATNSWSSDDDGDGLTDGRGIQIASDGAFSGAANGSAAATTKNNYTSVTKVIVTYSTNKSAGAGTIAIKVNNVAYTGNASVTSTGGTSDRTIEYTPTTAQTGKVNISVSCTTNSIFIKSVQIYYTGAGTVYEQYRTACCNDPGFAFVDENSDPVTEYVIVREDLANASDAVEIDCNYTSSNTTGAITWYSTRRAAKTCPNTGAYTWTTRSSQPVNMNIDLANKKIAAKETGVWTITISQADGGTTYCPVDAVVTVRVKTVDKFVDAVNGNFGGDAQRREDTGDGITLPTEAEFSIDDGCSTERRLLGWVKESDLSSYTSGYIDSWKTDDPATNKVIAPGTKVEATGITWYAVWGTEK